MNNSEVTGSTPNEKLGVRNAISTFLLRGSISSAMCLADIASVLDKRLKLGLRDRLPEPVDILDHAGNFSISLAAAGVASHIGARIAEKYLPKHSEKIAFGLGMVASVLANVCVETAAGVDITGIDNKPEPLDMAYGLVAGAVGASVTNAYRKIGPNPIQAIQEY